MSPPHNYLAVIKVVGIGGGGVNAVNRMIEQGLKGSIINIISTSGIKIVPMQGVYAGTKNAVRTISEALRQEAGANLRVTGISPGVVQTELADNMTNPDMKAVISENMKKLAISPDAIASAVAFAIAQPAHVEVGDIVIRPTAQG